VLECEEQIWWQRRAFPLGGTHLLDYMGSQNRNVNINCSESNCRKIPTLGTPIVQSALGQMSIQFCIIFGKSFCRSFVTLQGLETVIISFKY
jgi:hypothetical protein